MFNLTEEQIEQHNAGHTTREIHHQPSVWRELMTSFFSEQDTFKSFVNGIYQKHDHVRVIFSGAGTSAFVGDTLVPELSRLNKENVTFESIATTDVVSNPTEYLFADQPTILVSFARSGNSPESVATVALAQDIVKDFYQVVITCNRDGQLADNIKHDDNSLTLLMPERSNDKSLAMTSSFSAMIMAAYALFTDDIFTGEVAKQVIEAGEKIVDSIGDQLDDVLAFDFDRIVYLGSGALAQLSHEAALKMLELSGGQVVTMYESSLGFRHGPKSILTDQSIVLLFMSQDPYTKKYDMDILRELAAAETGMKIAVLSETKDPEVTELADFHIAVNEGGEPLKADFNVAVLYIIFAQALAMKKAIQLGMTPDNPSPDGAISRVVKGVTIHKFD